MEAVLTEYVFKNAQIRKKSTRALEMKSSGQLIPFIVGRKILLKKRAAPLRIPKKKISRKRETKALDNSKEIIMEKR